MITNRVPCKASSRTLKPLSTVCSRNTSLEAASQRSYYTIDFVQYSETTLLLFTALKVTKEQRIVIKILRNYKDTRFNLETPAKRLQCQLNALQLNAKYTNQVYIGIAPIYSTRLSQKPRQIALGKIIKDPHVSALDPTIEYALLMHELPKERQLDSLLMKETPEALLGYLCGLSTYIGHMHKRLKPLSACDKDGIRWGSCKQLEEKLQHNLDFFKEVLPIWKYTQSASYERLESIFRRASKILREVLHQPWYRKYFEQRMRKGCIKCCHGDLKAAHTWILPYDPDPQTGDIPQGRIQILDAVDFNPNYNNIDMLSDFAMLIVDIQAHMESPDLVNPMIESYLRAIEQDNSFSRTVLAYYLVEKALIGIIVNTLYDERTDLALSFLNVLEMRVKKLEAHRWCVPFRAGKHVFFRIQQHLAKLLPPSLCIMAPPGTRPRA
ncbi:MAG: hypothetical protein ABI456_12600 [Ktedonobacteraceae bacterium]|nr:hypothetical protein [Chloroflexota bacterium]